MSRWRVGAKLGRTLYRNDQCVGMVDTPGLAEEIVEALSARASQPEVMPLREALVKALATPNTHLPYGDERRTSDGSFLCHACKSNVSEERAGCVNSECWVEEAERLLGTLNRLT